MKHHNDALSIYMNFSAMIHTHFDTSIYVFYADYVRGYLSDAHAQNEVVERKHRHLFEIARALMIASSVLPHFWAMTISTTTYLINIQPSSTLHGGISFECLCGKTSDYSSFRIFDCVCYVFLAPHECTKLIAQFVECVFIGYSAEHKGYRC
jgi:hypothetical protein